VKRLLIVGGSGIIGNSINDYLAKNTYHITSIGRSNKNGGLIIDLLDLDAVNKFVMNSHLFDIIIFLVGLAHSRGKGKNFSKFKETNVLTLKNLFDALKRFKKIPDKIIFASTISVYGESFDKNIYNEDTKLNPSSPYAITKLLAEKYLINNYKEISWILRFAPVYSENYLVNINRRTKIAGKYYLVGDGSSKLSLCNMVNINWAIDGIINNRILPDIYNISDPKPYSYCELLKWQNAKILFRFPIYFVKLFYYCGKIFKNNFIKENTIKLITNNIFPSDKIRSNIDMPTNLFQIKPPIVS